MQDLPRRAHPLRRRRPRDRPREHRGHLRRDRVRAGHAGRRGADRLARGARRAAAACRTPGSRSSRSRSPARAASSSSRSTTRAAMGRQQDHGRPQGEHHEVHRRPLAARRARGRRAENPDIEFDDRIADNMCMQLVQRPEEYDVLVLPNLYGDIVSDLAAGLIGGLGVAPGANFGEDVAVFEPTHGSAPKYAGQNKVNPIAADALRDADAAPPRRGRRRRPPRGGDRRPDPRGQERHLRHEAVARRPDRGRDERGRRRADREARKRSES